MPLSQAINNMIKSKEEGKHGKIEELIHHIMLESINMPHTMITIAYTYYSLKISNEKSYNYINSNKQH